VRTTHKLYLTRARIVLMISALLTISGLIFAFAPMPSVAAARQSMAARLSANPAITKILSLTPEYLLRAIGINASASNAGFATLNDNEDISISSVPPNGNTVPSGGFIVYTITATNGPAGGGADNLPTITVNIPAGTIFKGVTTGGSNPFTCQPPATNTPGPASFVCSKLSPFASNSNSTLTVAVQVTAPSGTISANATYDDADSSPETSNTVTHPVATPAGPAADLQLLKLSNKNEVIAGAGAPNGRITYTLQVRNNGPNAANGVAVFDEIPTNTTLVGSPTWTGAAPGSCFFHVPSQKFFCRPDATDAALPVGASATVTYTVEVPASVTEASAIVNAALVTSIKQIDVFNLITTPGVNTSPDPTPTNNHSLTHSLVRTVADLKVEYTNQTGPDPVCAGDTTTYVIKATNQGPSDAVNVTFTNLLNLNHTVLFVSLDTSLAPGFVCSTPSTEGTGQVSCKRDKMPAGEEALFSIKVRVPPDFMGDISYNRAFVLSDTFDPVNSGNNNNEKTAGVEVKQCADVEVVSKIDNPDPVVAGEKLTFDIVVRNNGPSDAQNVVFSDPIPPGTTFDSVSATGVFAGRCDSAGVCKPPGGVFPSGATSAIRIVVKVNPGATGPINNNAAITTSTNDTNPNNNSKQSTTNVIKRTDITVKKTGPSTVTAGNQYTYTMVVRNNGPSDAPSGSVTMVDTLDSRLTYVNNFTTDAGGFSCSNSSGTVTCSNGSTLPADGFGTITIVFRVKDNVQANAIIPNTATVSTNPSDQDPNKGNDKSTTSTAGQTSADLQLTKTATAGPATAGIGTITYTIFIGNSGPSNANGVKVNDNIPANTALVTGPTWTPGAGSPAGSCSVGAGGAITCMPSAAGGVLQDDQTATITYTVSVPASALNGSLATNQAIVASTGPNATPDPNPSNNTQDPTSTLIVTSADLSVVKDQVAPQAPAAVVAGTTVTYRIRVKNSGPSDAQNVAVTDQFDANTTFVSVDASGAPGFTCVTPAVGSSGTLACARGVVPPGAANYDILVTVRARPGATGSVTNLATVSSSTSDPVTGNNTDSETTPVATSADLELVSKTDSPDAVVAGNNLTYTLTFRNNGPSAAQGVVISDTIPVNTTFLAVNPPVGYSCAAPAAGAGNPAVITCSPPGGALAAGAIAEIKLTVKVSANPSSLVISNTASISATTNDPVPGNNSKSESTTVERQTDLTVRKTGPATVTAGNTYTYTIVVRNDGPSDAPANTVTLSDTLNSNLTFNAPATVTGDGGFTCSNAGNAVTCANGALFSANGFTTITLTFTANTGVPQNTIIANTATVSSPNDPNGANNTSTTSTAGQTSADLQLAKTSSPPSVIAGSLLPGDEITYTIPVLNSGPSVANNVVVSDFVPANTIVTSQPVFVSTGAPAITMACAAAVAGAQFTCSVTGSAPAGSMPVGSGGAITYKVRVPANMAINTIITNQAQIASTGSSATPDPNPANNTQAPTSTLVNARADLSITKTDSPDPVTAGSNLTYTLTVANVGPSDAQNVVVTDPAPANTTLVSVASSDPGFVCVNSNNTVTCSKATLAASASATISIVVKVNPNTPNGATLTNTATVSSTTTDPGPGANSATTTTTVNTSAVFTIAKSDNPDPAIAGANLSYRVTLTNNGPSDAQNVVMTDTLPNAPAGAVSFISVKGSGSFSAAGACAHSAGVITCTAAPGGVMPAGATADVDIVVKVNSFVPAGATLTNTAVVTSPTSAQTAAARTAVATTTVRHQSDLSLVKDAPDQVIAGSRIDYKLTITNGGPSDVLGGNEPGSITIVDDLPAGVMPVDLTGAPNFVVSGPGGFTCGYDMASNRVTCKNAAGAPGNFPVNSVATIIFKVKTAPDIPDGANLVNCATIILPIVTSDPAAAIETDPNGGNNESCDSTVVRISADLGVTKVAAPVSPVPGSNPPAVRAGENIRYTTVFGNAGPSGSVNVRVTDIVPGNTSLVTAFPLTVTGTGGVKVACSYDTTTHVITCTPGGNTGLAPSVPDSVLPAGFQGTLVYEVKVNSSVSGGTIIANAANITSAPNGLAPGAPDPNPGNNQSQTTSTPVVAGSQLSITKIVQSAVTVASLPNQTGPLSPASPSDGSGTTGTAVVPGTRLTYRVTLTNKGPSDVVNLRVLETLPSNVKFVTVAQTGGFGTILTCQPPIGNPDPNGLGGVIQCTAPLMSATAPNNVAAIDVTVDIDAATKASLVNKADFNATINNFNQPVSATTTLTTPAQPVSDLALSKTVSPDTVFPSTNTTYALTVKNNGPSVAAMVEVKDNLPAGQSLVEADTSGAPGFGCSGVTGTITCSAPSLAVGATAVIKLKVFIATNTTAGVYTNTATASSMSFDPTPATATAKLTVVTKDLRDPGATTPVSAEVSDQKPGAILFFPIYTSDAARTNTQNTRINITNISETERVCVHLFAVDGASCSVLDAFVCMTPNQTASFLAADFDPGSSGYVMAVAVDCQTGLPTSFNCLIGDEYVKFSSGHAANLGAEAIAATAVFPVGTNANVASVTLKFDGVNYNRLPSTLAASNIQSASDGNSTMLIVNRVGGNFALTGATIGAIAGQLFDDQEVGVSFTANLNSCQARLILSNAFPRTFTPFSRFIDAGHTGWMKFWGVDDGHGAGKALLGAMINFNSAGPGVGAFNQGHNLHKLVMTDKAELVVPVFPPTC